MLSLYGMLQVHTVLQLAIKVVVAFSSWRIHVKEWRWDFGKQMGNSAGYFSVAEDDTVALVAYIIALSIAY